jgi:transcriptional regulator with XRE-family HTH domain
VFVVYSYESFQIEFAAKIRALRHDRGWSLRWMITEYGFHISHWQGFEKGRGISLPSLMRLCEVFDLTLEELIGGLGRVESPMSPEAAPAREASAKPQTPQKTNKLSRGDAPAVKRAAKTAKPASRPSKKTA